MIRKTNYVPKDFSPAKNTEKSSQPKNNIEKDNRKIAIQSIENSAEKEENKKNEITEEKNVSKTNFGTKQPKLSKYIFFCFACHNIALL